jgi:ATP-dependent phosphofructokinase / diphosphate-dependent phosphofructokinase
MGWDAGWIALEAGIAGRAHAILVPEIPYQLQKVLEKIHLRKEGGSPFSIIVVTEGAKEIGKDLITSESAPNRLQSVAKLGGVCYHVAHEIGERIDLEFRCTVLGHTQRGATQLAFDRVLRTRLGKDALQAAADKKFDNMVALQGRKIILAPLKSLAGIVRQVPLDSQLIRTAESIGVCLGR